MPSGDEEEIATRDEVFLCFAAFFEACAFLECPTCNPSLTRQGAGRPECLDLREFDRERTSQIALNFSNSGSNLRCGRATAAVPRSHRGAAAGTALSILGAGLEFDSIHRRCGYGPKQPR
jgi:hypothetical protein